MYKVRFEADGETRYGIVNKYAEEAKLLTEGHYLVEDAITPETFILTRDQIVELPLDEYPSELDIYIEKRKEESQKLSDSLETIGVGKLFTVPNGEGVAYYEIVSVKDDQAHIEWRAFDADRHVAKSFGYGGKFDLERISALIRSEKKLAYLNKRAAS